MSDEQNPDAQETLLEFPTHFPIKAMGRTGDEFRSVVLTAVADHAEFNPDTDVREQQSANGNFISITVTFMATSKDQVDAIYRALTDHELVLMVF